MIPLYDPAKETTYHIAGDPPEHYQYHGGLRDGQFNDPRGAASDILFDKLAAAHPQIRWRDRLLTCDLYEAANELTLVLICPKCLNQLRISSKQKHIDWDPERGISIERFMCTWEAASNDRPAQHFGMSLCRWSVVVENGIAKDT